MKKEPIKATKYITPAIIKKVEEGYTLRKAISVAGLDKKSNKKK